MARSRRRCRLVVALLTAGLLVGAAAVLPGLAAAQEFADGDGSDGNPYEIENWTHLNNTRDDLDANYRLVADLNASTDGYSAVVETPTGGFVPIGTTGTPFTGEFDGNGHEIGDLVIDRGDENQIGLFGQTGSTAHIRNVGVVDVNVTGQFRVGGLVGKNVNGEVSESYVTGNVSSPSQSFDGNAAGGLVGLNDGGMVSGSHAATNVTGDNVIGGLVGRVDGGTVSESYATGTTRGEGFAVGGLVGSVENSGMVSKSYATGTTISNEFDVAGLVGMLNTDSMVSESYATGNVSGDDIVGGLVGTINDGTVSESYATGNVNNTGGVPGGLVGDNRDTVTNSYWDDEASTLIESGSEIDGQAVGDGDGSGVTALTTAEMTGDRAPATMAAFDFGSTWQTVADDPDTDGYAAFYPVLQTNSQSPPPAGTLFAGGTGTEADPYEITEWTHLDNSREALGANYTLSNDLNETTAGYGGDGVDGVVLNASGGLRDGEGFEPVGVGSGDSFAGRFNGSGYTIAALRMDRTDERYAGLFGRVDGATITDVGLQNASIAGDGLYVGGLAGLSAGDPTTISGTYVTGTVAGEETVGGLVAEFGTGSSIENAYSTADVGGADAGRVGGLVGDNYGTIATSYATGNVTSSASVGVLVGYANGDAEDITNSYWDAEAATVTQSGTVMESRGIGRRDGDATGLTTAEMTGDAAEQNMGGFDFGSTWQTVTDPDRDGYAVSYPILQNTSQSPAPGGTLFTGGNGTEADPYRIESWTQLNNTRVDLDANYTLAADLNASTDGYAAVVENPAGGFVPIGNDSTPFTGDFNGTGHEIGDLVIDGGAETRVGLFGVTGGDVHIERLGVVNVSLTGETSVGGLVGKHVSGNVSDAYATGTVSGTAVSTDAGGLIGANTGGTVSASNATVNVSGDGSGVGGLVGHNDGGTVEESSATGPVSGTNYVGGLVGYNDEGTVRTSFATGSISDSSSYVGGLVGWNYKGTVEESYATGNVSDTDYVGGLVGWNDEGTVAASYATGTVSGSSDVGGLLGLDDGTVTNSYWDTESTGQVSSAGGTGLTTAQMTGTNATRNMDGFDFGSAWQTVTEPGRDGYLVSYPILQNNSQSPPPGRTLFAGGTGTEADPYEIADWDQLNDSRVDLDANYTLVADLDASTDGYTAVIETPASGFDPVGSDSTRFTGTFDGAGYTISNLTVNRSSETYVGLFGYVGSAGTVESVTLADVNVSGTSNQAVGGLVGYNDGTVRESSATGNVSGSNFVGGLVGDNDGGTVRESYATGNVSGSYGVGGLAGINRDTVRESYATGNVSGSDFAGGLVGLNSNTVDGSYWDTNSTGQANSAAGTNRTTAEMTGLNATDSMNGFAFGGTWHVTESYPALAWEDTAPFYGVGIDSTTSPVTGGQTLTVRANVTNWGADSDGQPVTLTDPAGSQVDSKSVPLTSGANEVVPLAWSTDGGDAGSGNMTVDSGNDTATASVTIRAPSSSDSSSGGGGGATRRPPAEEVDTVEVTDGEGSARVSVTTDNGVSSAEIGVTATGPSTIGLSFDQTADGSSDGTEDGASGETGDGASGDTGGASDGSRADATLRGLTIRTSDDADGAVSVREGTDVSRVSTDGAEPLATATDSRAANYIDVQTEFDDVIDSATFEVDVSAEAVDDPADATVYHYTDGEWTALDTEPVETAGETYSIEATTEGFSTFAVGVEAAPDPEPTEPAESDDSESTDDGLPGFGIGAALIALGVVLAVGYGRRQ